MLLPSCFDAHDDAASAAVCEGGNVLGQFPLAPDIVESVCGLLEVEPVCLFSANERVEFFTGQYREEFPLATDRHPQKSTTFGVLPCSVHASASGSAGRR